MNRVISPVLLCLGLGLLTPHSAESDVLLLKEGQRIKGDIRLDGKDYAVKTSYGSLSIPKSDVARVVPRPETARDTARDFDARAKTLYEAALKIDDSKARNDALNEGIALLEKAVALCSEVRDLYPDDEYGFLDQEMVRFFQAMRLFRDKFSMEKPLPSATATASTPAPGPDADAGKPKTDLKKPPARAAVPAKAPADLPALQAKAKQGDAEAMCALGFYYEETAPSPKEAAKWYIAATKKGHPRAQYSLGRLHTMGYGVKADNAEAVKWFTRAAQQDFPLAQAALGLMYVQGKGVERNRAKALYWSEKAVGPIRAGVQSGDPESQLLLGKLHLIGLAVSRDQKAGLALIRQAADSNVILEAQADFIRVAWDDKLVERETVKNTFYLKQAQPGAARNYAPAVVYLGIHHQAGIDTVKNEAKAVELFRKAAEVEFPYGQYRLAMCYEKGIGVAKDFNEGLRLCRKAAENGSPHAQQHLGILYQRGDLSKADPDEAVKWYKLAATDGNLEAMFNLGVIHILRKSTREGLQCLMKAAEGGYSHAQYALGMHFEEGKGVAKDPRAAAEWYLMAAQHGHETAAKRLDRLLSK